MDSPLTILTAVEKTPVNLGASALDVSEPDLAGVLTVICLLLPTDGLKGTIESLGDTGQGVFAVGSNSLAYSAAVFCLMGQTHQHTDPYSSMISVV